MKNFDQKLPKQEEFSKIIEKEKLIDIQQEADFLIEKYNLEKDLAEFGEAHLVGSAALKTMLKPDIDYQIYVKEKPSEEIIKKIIDLLASKDLKDTIIRELDNKYLISTAFNYGGKRWIIDITLTKPSDDYLSDSYKFLVDYKSKLDDLKRKTIIELKKNFFDRGLLHKGMTYYIYRAALDENISDAEGVENYLSKNGLSVNNFSNK